MNKISAKLHRGLGVFAALFICLSCLTGAMLVFTDEWRECFAHQRYYNDAPDAKPLPLHVLIPRVQEQVPGRAIAQVEIYSDQSRNYIFGYGGKDKTQIFVNPYNAEVVEVFNRGEDDVFALLVKLHRWLLDGTKTWGKAITGASTLIFVLVLISGIIYWLPRDRRSLTKRLSVKTNASRYRFVRDMHASLGIYAVTFLLLMSLTGLTWSYPWCRSGLYAILGVEVAAKDDKAKSGDKSNKAEDAAPLEVNWDNAYRNVRSRCGAYRYIRLQVGKAQVRDLSVWGNIRREDTYKWEQTSGVIKEIIPYAQMDAESRVRGWIYTLHAGLWGGLFSKILYFIVCLLGASFPISGCWLYLRNKKQARAKKTCKV